MRKLGKLHPPGNVSPAGQQPRSMQQAEAAFLAGLPAETDKVAYARSSFDALEKGMLRAVLYEEQGSLCIYCEGRVSEKRPTRIDHWRPLRENPELALHWRNLHLSCRSPTTCDSRKGESALRTDNQGPELPWPVDHHYEHCLGFSNLGEMYVRSDAPMIEALRQALVHAVGVPHDKTTGDNGILNLNHPALVAARKAAVDGERERMERDFKGKTATEKDRAARAAALLQEQPLREYVSIRVCWLTRTLGLGQ